MKILVINAGSSSLKYQLIDMKDESVIAKGNCEKIGLESSFIKHKTQKGEIKIDKFMPTHNEAIELVLSCLLDKEHGAIKSLDEIGAVGHRVLHGGEIYTDSVLVDDEVMKILKASNHLVHCTCLQISWASKLAKKLCQTSKMLQFLTLHSTQKCQKKHSFMLSHMKLTQKTKFAVMVSMEQVINMFQMRRQNFLEKT